MAVARVGQQPHWLGSIADPVRLQILRTLSEVTEASAPELATHSPASYGTLRRHLEALEASGVIEMRAGVSSGRLGGRPAARFRLAAGVRESICATFAGAA
jgi:predicted ArsR family transcriptional regulator